MKKIDIIRAWKDESYRNSLSAEQLAQLPANPAGNLSEEQLNMVAGGGGAGLDYTAKTYTTCIPCMQR